MTFEQLGQRLKSLFPHYQQEDTRTLAISFLRAYPQYLDLVSPLAREMLNTVSEPIETDDHWFHPKAKEEADRAQALEHRASRVRNLHDIEMNLEASARGIPREILGSSILQAGQTQAQFALMTHSTDEQIRLETHKTSEQIRLEIEKKKIEVDREAELAEVAIEAAREQALHQHRILEELKTRLFKTYEERWQVSQGDSPVKAKKLAVLNKEIKLLEQDFYGRARQTLVSAIDWARLGAGEQDTKTDGHKDEGTKPDSK